MGSCNTTAPSDDDFGTAHSKNVDRYINKAKAQERRIHKLLLLGTGNSGKSTFFKQLQQIHGGGFHEEEFTSAAKHIQDAVVVQMKNLLMTFKCAENDDFKSNLNDELLDSAQIISNLSPEQPLSSIADHIEKLWAHQTIQDAYKNRTNLGISDSAPHFFDDLDRIKSSLYRPTAQDILLARIPTTGIREKKFEVKGSLFNIFDVGGQRSERNKWIHCFESVHGILFVASLSCYDQMLYEENELNAMYEALELFSIVINSRYFAHASVILFLNKSDLFAIKIQEKSLKICFQDYEGDNSMDDTVAFIKEKFKQQCTTKEKKNIYAHVTCATDVSNVRRVFDDVQHFVVTNALKHNGLI